MDRLATWGTLRRRSPRRRGRRGSLGLALALSAAAFEFAAAPTSGAATSPSSDWLAYHANADGAGVGAGVHVVDTSRRRWTSPRLDGDLYGEPLVLGHDVVVATENDSLYALSTSNGAVVWRRHLATAVASSSLPCGDIAPVVGVTGTPVIDPARHEIFLMTLEDDRGIARHVLYGLDVTSGRVMMRRAVVTPTSDQTAYLNRSALALDHGEVIYTLGGNYGDCANYHGVVGAAREDGSGHIATFVVDHARGQREGAIWMGGAAAAVDAAGNVWVASGNGSVTRPGQPYDDSDAVLELSPAMRLEGFFAPATWAQDNANDADLSAQPAVLADGLVVATGKSGQIYLLRATHLGGVGGQLAEVASGCGNVLDGGTAHQGVVVYLPCASGPIAVRVSIAGRLDILWRASSGGGPPIVAGDRVWSIGAQGVLYGFDATTGVEVQHAKLGALANHFSTPSVGAGLMLAPIARQVVAFAAH
ncbi:MAG: PQQ-binding-like beta-propeller repeat protein [Acidobacteria bacterium]|nr:PQQ-binding-like beta-propeller repeat protein [Acidobacteriota bacterium]